MQSNERSSSMRSASLMVPTPTSSTASALSSSMQVLAQRRIVLHDQHRLHLAPRLFLHPLERRGQLLAASPGFMM